MTQVIDWLFAHWGSILLTAFTFWGGSLYFWSVPETNRKRARAKFKALHGEPVDFTKHVAEGGSFLREMVRLEEERVRLKHEKLTTAEREAASGYLNYLMQSMPVRIPEKFHNECWELVRKDKAFAQRALEFWANPPKHGEKYRVTRAGQTPAEMVAELAGMTAPLFKATAGDLPREDPERLFIPGSGIAKKTRP